MIMGVNMFGKPFSYWLYMFEKKLGFQTDIMWPNMGLAVVHHVVGAYWCYHYAGSAKWQTVVFAVFMYVFTGLGVTTGAHRYWSHRQFKANKALQLLIMYLWTTAGQYKIRYWVLMHRMHHKYSDTPADPHDINRGLWFAQIGCLILKPTPECVQCEKLTDLSDIDKDKLVQFHDRHYIALQIINCFVIPIAFNVWMWEEDWKCAVAWQMFIRYLAVFHAEMTLISLAHSYGTQPHDTKVKARDNMFVVLVSGGEGWHNFHHTFPYDHRCAEDPVRSITTVFIKAFAKIGWAYDLKKASPEAIEAFAKGTDTVEDETDHWMDN